MQTYCGVDIGTTNVKVLLADAAGRVLSRVAQGTPRRDDRIGVCSDPAEIVDLVEQLIVQAAAAAGLHAPLRSISVAGIGEDGVGVDVAGNPLGLAIAWFDERAGAEARDLHDVAAPYVARTGIAIDAARTAAKWLWLARHAGGADNTVTWIALADYPAFVWTGTPFMSETLAARTGCYDCIERTWLQPLLTAACAPPLPPVVAAGEALGCVRSGRLRETGLADEHTVVVSGGHDHPLAASVILGIDPHAVIDSMGTAELVYAESDLAFTHGFPATALPYLARSVRVGGQAGAAALGVFELSACVRPLLDGDSPRAGALRAIVAGAPLGGDPGSGGLRFDPRAGSRADDSWIDTSADAARAVFEGCTMYTRRIIDASAAAGFANGPIFTTGGWTNSQTLLKLRADVLGQPLHLVDEPQLAALGAALCGARAVGDDGAALRRGLSRRVVSNTAATSAFYAELYARYRVDFDRPAPPRTRFSPIGTTA